MNGPLLGQGEDYAGLLERSRRLRTHHGVLLEGPPGFGKSHAALEIAAALLCHGDDDRRACGRCPDCIKVRAGNHPDLHLVSVPEDKRAIPVDAVRKLQSALGLGSVEGRARVAIIDPADRLGEQGQNALLKTLEEPGDATFLILTARRPEGLLATVRSRVVRYRLRGASRDELAAALELVGAHPERRARALDAAQGSVGLAREFCGEAASRADDAISGVLAGNVSPFQAATAILDGADGRVEADHLAKMALRRCASLCRTQLAGDGGDRPLAPGRAAPYAPAIESWIQASEAVFAAEQDLAVEIAPHSALGELFLRWTEIFAVG